MKKIKSRVTLCMPSYNVERVIEKALLSIFAQSMPPIEVFVSDNHSTDGTCEIVNRFRTKGANLVICPIPPVRNGTQLDNCESCINNWNSLLKYGTAPYIALFHSDDIYEPAIIEREADFMDRHPECGLVFTMGTAIDEDDRPIPIRNSMLKRWLGSERVFEKAELVSALMEWGPFLQAPTAMIRRDSWRAIGGMRPQFEQACDLDWWLRFAMIGKVGIINQDLYRRRISNYHGSAAAKTIYKYTELPFYWVIDDSLENPELRKQIPVHVTRKYEFMRAGDCVGPSIMYIVDRNIVKALEMLKPCQSISFIGALLMAPKYPRQFAQFFVGKILLLACKYRGASWLADWLSNHSALFRR